MEYARFIGVVLLIAIASYFISTAIFKRYARTGRKGAIAVRIISLILSFVLIAGVIIVLIMRNAVLER